MVKDVTSGPRVSQDFSTIGTQHTEETETKAELTPDQVDVKLEGIGNGTLGAETETLASKGSAADTPRQDGQVKNRGDDVKKFFSSFGKGISDFFSKIGKAFAGAFEAIREAVTSRLGATEAPTPKADLKPLDKQGEALLDFCEQLGKDVEDAYLDYQADTSDDPKMTRSEFVAAAFPDLPGGADAIDKQSDRYVGDRISDVKAHLEDVEDPGLNEMRKAVVERLVEMPSLQITEAVLFEDELPALSGDPTTFLRENTAFSKLEKFVSREAIQYSSFANSTTKSVEAQIRGYAKFDSVDGVSMGMASLTKEQADAVVDVTITILNDVLDTDFDNPKSFLNQIPQSYTEFLRDKADTIMAQTDVDLQVRKDAVKTLYINSLFLRGISVELFTSVVNKFKAEPGQPPQPGQKFGIQTMQFMQSFMNGLDKLGKGNAIANAAFQEIIRTQGPRMNDFLIAVGMPNFGTENSYGIKPDDLKASDQGTTLDPTLTFPPNPFETMTEDDLKDQGTTLDPNLTIPPSPFETLTEDDLKTDGISESPGFTLLPDPPDTTTTGPSDDKDIEERTGDMPPLPDLPDQGVSESRTDPGASEQTELKDTTIDGGNTPSLEEDNAKL